MNWRTKIALWVLLGFALSVAETLWERRTRGARIAASPVHPAKCNACLRCLVI